MEANSPLVKNRPQTAIVEPKVTDVNGPIIVGAASSKDFGKLFPDTIRKEETQTEERHSLKNDENNQFSATVEYGHKEQSKIEDKVRESMFGMKDINIFASFCGEKDSEGLVQTLT